MKETSYQKLIADLDKLFPQKYGTQMALASIATNYAGAVSKSLIHALQRIKNGDGDAKQVATEALESLSQMLAES